ncbi:unnamed protein product, partial [Symbiodinium sp. CCMP2456]
MQQDMLMDWAVEDVSEDGAAVVEQRVERIVMQNKAGAGQEFKYDSDSEDPPAGMAALVAPAFDAMVAHPFQMTMLPTGEITEVTLSDELSKALDNLPGGAVSSDMIKQMSQQASLKFPTEPLAVGDKWTTTAEVTSPAIGKMKVHTTYTYDGVREVDGKTYEAFTPAIEMELGENKGPMAIDFDTKESTGEILFDREKGRVFRSRVLQTVDIRVKMGENEIVNSMKQAVEMRELGKDETPTLGAPAEEEAEVDTETDSEGQGRTVVVDDRLVAIFLVSGEYRAIDDLCPHQGASLGAGCVEDGEVYCPWHGWRFRLSDGKWADNPRLGIDVFETR